MKFQLATATVTLIVAVWTAATGWMLSETVKELATQRQALETREAEERELGKTLELSRQQSVKRQADMVSRQMEAHRLAEENLRLLQEANRALRKD